jgi:outer membrane protein assembly factor BamB
MAVVTLRYTVMLRNAAVVLLLGVSAVGGADWMRFRGPDGAGVAKRAPTPLEIRAESGYVWKRTVATGKSSPVLAGRRLFLTAHDGDRLLTMAFDRASGETLWTRVVRRTQVDQRNQTNDAAAPTPTTDGWTVFVFFADFGLIAYSVAGEEVWRRPLGPFTSPHGVASSPLLIEGVLVLLLEQRDDGAVMGIDAKTGELIWKVSRPPSLGGSFATPVAYRAIDGSMQAVVMSPFELAGYEPRTGEKLWRVGGLPHQPKSSPVVAGDLIVAGVQGDSARDNLTSWEKMHADWDADGDGTIQGAEIQGSIADYDRDGVFGRADYERWFEEKSPASRLMAVRPVGRGDLTSKAVVWSVDRGVPRVTTPLVYDGMVYLARNSGIFSVLDLATGAVLKEGRLLGAIDEYFASPVAAGGKILALSRGCGLTWIAAGADWKILRTNQLGEECFATPALAEDGVFVRTATALYRFGDGE